MGQGEGGEGEVGGKWGEERGKGDEKSGEGGKESEEGNYHGIPVGIREGKRDGGREERK